MIRQPLNPPPCPPEVLEAAGWEELEDFNDFVRNERGVYETMRRLLYQPSLGEFMRTVGDEWEIEGSVVDYHLEEQPDDMLGSWWVAWVRHQQPNPPRALAKVRRTVGRRRECYPAAEVVYHANGGRRAGYTPMQQRHENVSHWWVRGPGGEVLDPATAQFRTPVPYERGRGRGFLTKRPSRRARALAKQAGVRMNPDAQTRRMEREWKESGDPKLLERLVRNLERSEEHAGTDAYLAWLRLQWAALAARKRALRLSIRAYRRSLPPEIPRWQRARRMTGDQSAEQHEIERESRALADELARELGRHGKLWSSVVSGDYQTVSVRLHDEKDPVKGSEANDWVLAEVGSAPNRRGVVACLDIKSMRPGSPLRSVLERFRNEYGARSRILELREAEEASPPWGDPIEWAMHARGIAREHRDRGVVGWNPPNPDVDLRELERLAWGGDPEAARKLERARERLEPPPPSRLEMYWRRKPRPASSVIYVSPYGDYGEIPFSGLALHTGAAGRRVVQYALSGDSDRRVRWAASLYVDRDRDEVFVDGLPGEVLPDEVRRRLGGWGIEKVPVQSNPARDDGRYRFVHNCAGAESGLDIQLMREQERQITRRTFARKLAPGQWKWLQDELGYDRHLPISKADWQIPYFKSTYRGIPAVFLEWSGFEYIFTLDGNMGPSADPGFQNTDLRAKPGRPPGRYSL